ncbi:MAG: TolC family protein, partial [Bacteroidales bacterium]|nr:TolC family protein [Bacteroidales bacterium]
MKKVILGLLALLSVQMASAEVYHLNLDQSVAIARNKSVNMLNLEQDKMIMEYDMKATLAGLKTHIDMNFNLPQYTETIRSFEDTAGISYYPVRQLGYNANLSINQPLITDGRIYLSGGLSNTDDIYNSKRLMNMNTRIGFEQPLDAFYAYNNIRSSMRQAKLNYEQTQKQLKRQDLDLVYSVMSSFYNLLQVQKRRELSETNLQRQEEA